MLDITVRLLSEWLRHPEHGVNDLAMSIPRAVLGAGPVDPAPPLVTVVNDADDVAVAASLEPSEVPALMVFGDSDADTELKGYNIAKDVLVCAAFLTDESADALTSVRDCGYILRAARISLSRYNSSTLSAGYRELNGVKVMKLGSVTEHRGTTAIGRRKLWGFLRIEATVIDSLS